MDYQHITPIGLTGGIATGKSTIAAYARRVHGLVVFDADQTVRDLYTYNEDVIAAVGGLAPICLTPQGHINRTLLRAQCFSETNLLGELQALVQPYVHAALAVFLQSHQGLCVLDIPLLFQGGYDTFCHGVILTTCSATTQRQRLMERGLPNAQIEFVLRVGEPMHTFRPRACVMLNTDAPLEQTYNAFDETLLTLQEKPLC
jgi:dephospho-CoA kinase